ncbi:hypothetical protein ACFYOT_40460 [Saccharothrix saharensis]|uniref:hypothetical protein n=1 Tax=Saccharothrix saharensis TaxID=571190 RepID=UPI0036A3DF47
MVKRWALLALLPVLAPLLGAPTASAANGSYISNGRLYDANGSVLEAHDITGYGERSGAVTLNQAVDYGLGVGSALVGQEKYVINIGDEPYGNNNYGN